MGSDGGHFRCCCYFPAFFKKRSTSFICFFLSGGEERIQGERMNLSSMCQAGLRCEEPSVAHNVSLVESVFALHVSQSARASDWAAQATEIHVLTALGGGSPRPSCYQGRFLVGPHFLARGWLAPRGVFPGPFLCVCAERTLPRPCGSGLQPHNLS